MSVEVLTEDFESLEDRSLDDPQRPDSAGGEPTSCSSASRSSLSGSGWVPIIMGPRPERVYSQEVLLELRTCPLAARWPPYLNPIYRNARGVWDPDRWHLDLKRGETPPVGVAGDEGNYKGVRSEVIPGGVSEGHNGKRLRQVNERDLERVAGGEGLVLSPQRRSFQVGCQAPGSEPPEEKEPEVNLRPEVPQRRVGSGRILARDRDDKEYPPDRNRQEDRNRNDRNRVRDERDDTKYGFRRDHEDERRGGEWDKNDHRQPPSGQYFQHDDRKDRRDPRDDRFRDERERSGMSRRDPRDDHRDQDRWGNRRGDNRNDGRGGDRRGRQQSYNEPEWMTESVSKNDMIELRGFEDPKKDPPSSVPPPALPPGSISVEDLEREQRNAPGPPRPSSPRAPFVPPVTSTQDLSAMLAMDPAIINTDTKKAEGSFNFDDIMESIPGLNSIFGGPPGPADNAAQPPPTNNGQSRFSQFFQRGVGGDAGGPGQPPGPPGNSSRRSSIQDELLGANILREINGEPAIRIPSPSESQRFFAPISPAAQTSANSNPLLDMINKGHGDAPHGSMAHLMKNYKNNVEDIEAGIKRQLGLEHQQQQQQSKLQMPAMPPMPNMGNMQLGLHQSDRKDDELSAFKKLVAQMGPGPVSERPPPMMGGGFPQPPNARMVHPGGFPHVPGLVKPAPLPAVIPPNAPTEQEILEGLMGGRKANGHRAPPRPPQQNMISPQLSQYLGRMPLNRELLSRPEADHLMMGLHNGTITVDNLVQQLNNTALQQRQRDLLLNVLKLKTMAPPQLPRTAPGPMPPQSFPPPHLTVSSVGGQRGTSPLPDPLQNLLMQQQQAVQAARVSPLMFPHAPNPPHSAALAVSPVGNSSRSALSVSPVPPTQRVPSPQEMTIITQQIMQQALIKRKLEEQKENFRRRQGEGQGEENDTNTGSPSGPLAFTPTSVMRKTAAERRDSDPRPTVPEVKVTPQKDDGSKPPCLPQDKTPPSPGKRPAVLDLGQGRIPGMPQQRPVSPSRQMPPMGPMSGHGFPMPHTNPLLYLQNQINPGISPAMISQANTMAQQQMAAANLAHQVSRGVDPRLLGQRLPPPMFGQGPPSPRMQRQAQPQGGLGGLGGLGRFFSPEVLAQAQQGTLPPMPPLPTQKALTLEEIERQAAAVRI